MNKKILALFTTVCFVVIVNAQTKEEVVDKIAQQTCECIASKNIDMASENKSKLEMDFGLCLIESYNKNKKEAQKHFEFSILDEASIEGMAELVGMQMVSYCPDVFSVFIEEEIENENSFYHEEITGKFVSSSTNEFTTVIIKDSETNREHKLLWLNYFEGSELLNNSKDLKRQKLKVEYEKVELYDPKIKEYRNFKVIRALEILN